MVLRRDAPDFLQRRTPFERFTDSHHAQRPHPLADRLVLPPRRRRPLDDQAPDRLTHWQRFDQRPPAEIAAVFATVAAAAVIKDRALRHLHAEALEHLRLGHEFLAAIRADSPN